MKQILVTICFLVILRPIKSQNESLSNFVPESIVVLEEPDDPYMEDEEGLAFRTWRSESIDGEEEEVPDVFPIDQEVNVFGFNGIREPIDITLGHFSRLNNSYFILAPAIARPSSVYKVVVLPFRAEDYKDQIDVKASLSTSKGSEITFGQSKAYIGESTEILMELPDSLPPPYLSLRVEGSQGKNILFVNTTIVHPSNDFLIIMVQMARAVFTGDQQVEFRVILLRMDMTPYQEPVDIYIVDPSGYIVRRWVSRVPNTGVIELDFFTPFIPTGGFWRIRIKAGPQTKEEPFLVMKYYIPRFEIFFDLASYTLASEGEINVDISAAITNDAPLLGNMTVDIYAKFPWTLPDSDYVYVDTEVFDHFPSEESLTFPMDALQGKIPNLVGSEVKFEAAVLDSFTGITVHGYAKTRIINGDVVLRFLEKSPVIFRPGMPLTFTLHVAHEDDNPLDVEVLKESSIRVTCVANTATGSTQLRDIYIPPSSAEETEAQAFLAANEVALDDIEGVIDWDEFYYSQRMTESMIAKEMYLLNTQFADYRKTGVFSFTLSIPEDTISLTVSASFVDSEGSTAGTTLEGISNFSPGDRHLHVTSSTKRAVVGQFVVLHIRSNFILSKFHYVILSKGLIVTSATEPVPFVGTENVATISIAVSREMFPVFTFVAFYADENGGIASDFITIPVKMFHLLPAEVYLNQHKDHSKSTVEAFFKGPPGTFIFTSSMREAAYGLQPGTRLTQRQFMMACLDLEPLPRIISKVDLIPRNSANPKRMTIYSGGDIGGEAYRTLTLAALSPLSDTKYETSAPYIGRCEVSLGYFECGDGGCYRFIELCDGVRNCNDGSDEEFCQYKYSPTTFNTEGIPESDQYLLFRQSWWKDLFDTEDGSFGWHSEFIGHTRDEGVDLGVPATQDDWVFDVFAVNAELGFALLPSMPYSTDPPMFIVLDGPATCRRGEQVSIRTAIFNSLDKDLVAMLILPASDDYKFIHVEDKGVVDGYKPRTSGGEHHHIVFMPAGETKEVFIPLAITLQTGTLEVPIILTSQISRWEEVMEIEVRPEGAPVYKHTSALMDLKSRAVFYEFMDIPIDESPIITNILSRRFIFGSPQAQLTLSGDVFGPISEDIYLDYETAFNGRASKSSDNLAFNFGTTIWTLHYLRLTNQLVISESLGTFEYLNVQMSGLVARFKDNGFKMWHYSAPSVWLTAWVTNLLISALHEDWENYIYVDPRLLNDAILFLLDHQTTNGDFYESTFFNRTLDYKHSSQVEGRNASIGLTALTVATMQEVLPTLPGRTRSETIHAIWKGTKFLERSLGQMSNPYDIAITTWTLTVVGSPEKDIAVAHLLNIMRAKDGFLYWARKEVTTNYRNFENNQRTFVLPHEPEEWDADAIEATSYALMALLVREGVTIRQERIVNWLSSIRDFDYGFAASVDTVVALKALTEYCYRARLRDVTDIKVDVDTSAMPEFDEIVKIQQPFVAAIQTLEIPNPWGHVIMTARGAGQALAQLTMTYGVDVPDFLEKPPRKYWDFHVDEYHHPARNKSRITTTVCARWTAVDISNSSHAAMVEVELPTGYQLHQKEANKMVKKTKLSTFPQLSDSLVTDNYIYFQFSHIPSYRQCFQYDINRWFPVANLTFTRSAMIYELFAPDICEVCGSFQCPYCPFYSSSMPIELPPLMIISTVVLIYAVLYRTGIGQLMQWAPF